MAHKSGFVNIIGNPNVGKSTLMNALTGDKLSIITSKAQTTRHRILGILNENDFQIVFSDTPGILKPRYRLHESMMKFVGAALVDADVILYVTDVNETPGTKEDVLEKLNKTDVPVIVLVNKIDLTNEETLVTIVEAWNKLLPNAEILPIAAIKKYNLDLLLKKLISILPESEPYFSKDELTDKPERFFMAEIIREKILLYYHHELPYCTEVVVEEFKEDAKIIRIQATIHVARESQKGIIIGNKGLALKKVGIGARKDAESFFGKHIHLELHVKVTKDWRDNEKMLKHFGYNQS
ncbi:MAG: GTPase Era [Bacteroidia bacterium]|nr:GTPase Era [Bacteroidia bacterium]